MNKKTVGGLMIITVWLVTVVGLGWSAWMISEGTSKAEPIELWVSFNKERIVIQRLGEARPPVIYESEIKENINVGHKIVVRP